MNLPESIRYIDIHTHLGAGSDETLAVRNILAGEKVAGNFSKNTYFSYGIHPWYLNEENFRELKAAVERLAAEPDVIMIGEAGFDKLRGPDRKTQLQAFLFQADLAEQLHKPLIIHCVKYWDLLKESHKKINPCVGWVIHGFSGGAELADSLIRNGFWLSLGSKALNKEVLKKGLNSVLNKAPIKNVFLETDDSEVLISDIYKSFSAVTGRSEEEVSTAIKTNFSNLFQQGR